MMKTGELIVKETPDGELYFNIPDDLLDRLGWKEGDDIEFVEKDGGFILTKVRYENVELELEEETFTGVAKLAHENDITFNKQIELIMKEFIDKVADPDSSV
jgi:bifunctional DNA-binding transcriptional regulator/antitoxin component of YhaV-PrlF toxin-antitoxin module